MRWPNRALVVATVKIGPRARGSCPTSNTLFHSSTVYAAYNVHHPSINKSPFSTSLT
jgi:hypothetical protein